MARAMALVRQIYKGPGMIHFNFGLSEASQNSYVFSLAIIRKAGFSSDIRMISSIDNNVYPYRQK